MSYKYEDIKPRLFTEEAQVTFLRIRDEAFRLINKAGAVRSDKLLIGTGDMWTALACIDRLVELGELREITTGNVAGQHRVFVRPFE